MRERRDRRHLQDHRSDWVEQNWAQRPGRRQKTPPTAPSSHKISPSGNSSQSRLEEQPAIQIRTALRSTSQQVFPMYCKRSWIQENSVLTVRGCSAMMQRRDTSLSVRGMLKARKWLWFVKASCLQPLLQWELRSLKAQLARASRVPR